MRDGWFNTVLGKLADITTGSRAKGGAISSGIPSIGGEQIAEDRRIKFHKMKFIPKEHFESMRTGKLEFGDSLLVKDGATTGKVGYWGYKVPAAVNEHVFVLRAKPDKAEPYFINLLISHRSFRDEIESRTRGIIGGITRDIENIEIAVPSLKEQKRIVDLIFSVDSYIDALQQYLECAKKSRNAVLHELLTAGGDDWLKTSLGDVADVIDPHPSHRAPAVDDDGIPFIGIGDLRNSGDIDFAKARRVSKKILEEHKARYDRSDFLIGLGRVASIGMVVRLPDERTDYVVSPTLAVIKAKDMLGQFLFHLLEGPQSQEQFQRFKKGSTRESVGMQILRKIEVHIPPLPEQKRIVEIISSIDKVVDKTQLAINEAKNLRSGLLSDLLSGNHQIPASYDKVIGAA